MKFPKYEKFKESGVEWLGEVPDHWEVKRGRFTMDVNPYCQALRNLEQEAEVSFVPMEAVGEYGGIKLVNSRSKNELGGGYTEFQDNDVIVAKITPCFENGKGALATELVNKVAYGTTELHVLRVHPGMSSSYLFYMTISYGFRKVGESEMYGAGGQKRVPPEFCKNFRVPIPPIREQFSIECFLDRETKQIDTLIAKKKELVEKLQEQRSALISHTVTKGLPADVSHEFGLEPHTRFKPSGVEWLGDIPDGWEIRPLKYSGKIISGFAFSSADFETSGVRVLKISNVQSGRLDWTDDSYISEEFYSRYYSFAVKDGDVVFALTRPIIPTGIKATIANIEDERVLLNQRNALFRPFRGFDLKFLYSTLFSKYFISEFEMCIDATGQQPNISPLDICNIGIVTPPLLEQTAIATYLKQETTKKDDLIEKTTVAIDRLQEYRSALITAAVTGKIDVRNIARNGEQ